MRSGNNFPEMPAGHIKEPPDGKGGAIFILVGGFLGAGKTSFVRKLADLLFARGLAVGMISNDQGVGLVDTRRFQTGGEMEAGVGTAFVDEVTGGCFCCRADELVEKLGKMQESGRPDVIIAEPVGSCTDLIATVMEPLEKVYGLGMRRAPYAVLIDSRKIRIPGSRTSGQSTPAHPNPADVSPRDSAFTEFSPEIDYIYRKQIEEAGIIVLSKVDLLPRGARAKLAAWFQVAYPEKKVVELSIVSDQGVNELFDLLVAGEYNPPAQSLEVDYNRYAKGEALLGWYNAELSVHAIVGTFIPDDVLLAAGRVIQEKLEFAGARIAHLKLSLTASGEPVVAGARRRAKKEKTSLSVVQVVANDRKPELSMSHAAGTVTGKMLINLRAEAHPMALRRAVEDTLRNDIKGARFLILESAAFKPGRPVPLHRLS